MNQEIKLGDVYSWREPNNEYRVVAAMTEGEDLLYQVAVHHKGDSNIDAEGLDLWFTDFPENGYKEFKKASKVEVIELIIALLKRKQPFKVTKKHQIVLSEYEELLNGDRVQKWKNYLIELHDYYIENPALKNFSTLKKKYHIQGVTIKQFYTLELNKLSLDDLDDNKVIEIMNFVYKK